jgi:putative transposase
MKSTFQNKYRVDSARLKNFDYSKNGFYFVTICTSGKWPYFGKLVDGRLKKTPIAAIAEDYWCKIPEHFEFVKLDEFVFMPDHMHGLLFFEEHTQHCRDYLPESDDSIAVTGNKFGPQSKNLSSVIRNYKSAVTSYAQKNSLSFRWQSRFHDRVIRSESELWATRNYIRQNLIRG